MEKTVKILTVAVDDIADGNILAVDVVDSDGNCIFWKERILYTGDIEFLKQKGYKTVSIYPYDLKMKKKWLKVISSPQFYPPDEVKEVCRDILKNQLIIKESNFLSLLNNDKINVKDILYKYACLYSNNEKIFKTLLESFGANYFHDLLILKYLEQNRSFFLNDAYVGDFINRLKKCDYYYNLRDRMEDFFSNKFFSFFKTRVITELKGQNDPEEEKRLLNILKILKLEMSEYKNVIETLKNPSSAAITTSDNVFDSKVLESPDESAIKEFKPPDVEKARGIAQAVANQQFQSGLVSGQEEELKNIESSITVLDDVRKIKASQFSKEFYTDYTKFVINITNHILEGREIDYKAFQEKIYKLIHEVENNPGILEFLLRLKMSSTYLWQHSLNTSILMIIYGSENKLADNVIYYLAVSALFHDIGMIYLDRSIWDNPNILTASEKLIVEEHPVYGSYVLNTHPQFRGYSLLAYEHHERFKGSGGYPIGKSDRQINNYSRLFSILDSFEAMIFNRPYKETKTPYDAVKEIINLSGKNYDPKMVNSFIKTFSLYPPGTFIVLNDGRMAKVIKTDNRSIIRPVVAFFEKNGSKSDEMVLFENSALIISKVLSQSEAISSFS